MQVAEREGGGGVCQGRADSVLANEKKRPSKAYVQAAEDGGCIRGRPNSVCKLLSVKGGGGGMAFTGGGGGHSHL